MIDLAKNLDAPVQQPTIHKINLHDLVDAVSRGIDDFRIKPTHLFFLAIIYPVATLGAALVMADYSLLPLVFPIVSGFFLIGTFIGVGMYEMSHQREQGADLAWHSAFNFFHSPAIREIMALGLLLVALFLFWLGAAMTVYQMTLGTFRPDNLSTFMNLLFTTREGWTMIVVGNLVGLFFAITVFSISVVSFPLILEHHVGVGTAVATSIRAVLTNPLMMVLWGLFVVVTLAISALPLLVGIAVVFPILGHATWHLYRKVVY